MQDLARQRGANLSELQRKNRRGDREAATQLMELWHDAAEGIDYGGHFGGHHS